MRAPVNRPRWPYVSLVDVGEFEVVISEAFEAVPGMSTGEARSGSVSNTNTSSR